MHLTNARVKNSRPSHRPQKISDGGGLHLLLSPHGAKLWRLAYRYAGKQKTLALGSYPSVSLAEARMRRDEARRLLANGTDPSAIRKREKQSAKISAANNFRAVAEEYVAKTRREGRAAVTLAKKEWLLDFAYSAFGSRPIAEISAVDLLALVREIEARGNYETAKRLRATCGAVFRLPSRRDGLSAILPGTSAAP